MNQLTPLPILGNEDFSNSSNAKHYFTKWTGNCWLAPAETRTEDDTHYIYLTNYSKEQEQLDEFEKAMHELFQGNHDSSPEDLWEVWKKAKGIENQRLAPRIEY